MAKQQRTAEAILRDLVKAQDVLLTCYRLGDPSGGKHVDRIRSLREELEREDTRHLFGGR